MIHISDSLRNMYKRLFMSSGGDVEASEEFNCAAKHTSEEICKFRQSLREARETGLDPITDLAKDVRRRERLQEK